MDEHQQSYRRAMASGDTAAAARWLRGRMRSGLLAPERVSLAAYLGDEAAQAVGEVGGGKEKDLGLWIAGLTEFDSTVSLRAYVAIARALEAKGKPKPKFANFAALAEIEAYLTEDDVRPACVEQVVWWTGDWRSFNSADHALTACALELRAQLGIPLRLPAVREAQAGAKAVGKKVRLTLRDELVPWAIGVGDPVAERLGFSRTEAPSAGELAERLSAVRDALTPRLAGDAFVASLATRRLDLRLALDWLLDAGEAPVEDLEALLEDPPQRDERSDDLFAGVLAGIRALPSSAGLVDLLAALKAVPGNKRERIRLGESLGHCGVLRPDPRGWKAPNDWRAPAAYWRGSMGVDEKAVARWFPGFEKAAKTKKGATTKKAAKTKKARR